MTARRNALFLCFVLSSVLIGVAMQSPDPPLSDTRLRSSTLLREDIFAGFMSNDMTRFSRGERNIDILLKERPADKAELTAWKAGTELYRAVIAHEASRADEFQRVFAAARDGFAEAAKLSQSNDGVLPIMAGSHLLLGDRLPEQYRAAAWSHAYDGYSMLWKTQAPAMEKMPVHFRGEVLAGMAMSAYRMGRSDESAQFVDRLIALVPDTAYEAAAKQWKANPGSTTLTCKSCHTPGRLADRIAALNKGGSD